MTVQCKDHSMEYSHFSSFPNFLPIPYNEASAISDFYILDISDNRNLSQLSVYEFSG